MLAVRTRLPQFIERAKTQTLAADLYENGAAVVPASGTVTIYDQAGTKIVDAAVVTLTSTGVSYSLSSALVPDTLSFSDRWRVVWVLVVAGETHTIPQQAHLCRSRLYPVISDLDIYERHPDLAYQLPPNVTTWQAWIDGAFITIEQRLLADSKRPYMILSPHAVAEPHLLLTLSRICRSLATQAPAGQGRFATDAVDYLKQYDDAWGGLRFDYDFDQDGLLADDEENVGAEPVVYLNNPPSVPYWPVYVEPDDT